MSSLGRFLYPKLHPRLRRKRMRALGLAIMVGLMASCLFAAALLLLNKSGPVRSRAVPSTDAPPPSR